MAAAKYYSLSAYSVYHVFKRQVSLLSTYQENILTREEHHGGHGMDFRCAASMPCPGHPYLLEANDGSWNKWLFHNIYFYKY